MIDFYFLFFFHNSDSMIYVFDNLSLFMSKWNRVANLRKMMEKAKPLATNSILLLVSTELKITAIKIQVVALFKTDLQIA